MDRSLSLEHFDNRPGLLSGVWFTEQDMDPQREYWKDQVVNMLYFMLDGIIYRVQEDPDDGYRSHLRNIIVVDQMPLNVWQPAEEVWLHYRHHNSDRVAIEWDSVRNTYRDDRCNIVEFVSRETGECVLEFGTDDSEDYYPAFVASFHPEAMSINNPIANMLGEEKKHE